MKQKKVFLMSGPPASGKSTWVRSKLLPGSEWISRDKVRFAIVSEDEDYFAREDEVFDTFINYINRCLDDDVTDTIFIDATHLNEKSRHKTLSRVNKEKITKLTLYVLQHRSQSAQSETLGVQDAKQFLIA